MKKIVLATVLLFGMGMSAQAQDEVRREKPDAERMTDRMKSQLELTDVQYKKVFAVNEEIIKMMEEAGGREADRDTRSKIRKQHLLKLNEILTSEQMDKKKNHHEKGEAKKEKMMIEK